MASEGVSSWEEELNSPMLPLPPPRPPLRDINTLPVDDVEHWGPYFEGSTTSAVAPAIEEGMTDGPRSRSPRVQFDIVPVPTDSMVTVRLSDATVDPSSRHNHRRSSLDIMHGVDIQSEGEESSANQSEEQLFFGGRRPGTASVVQHDGETPGEAEPVSARSRSSSMSSAKSFDSAPVDWVELDRTEECEAREEGADEATAFLLARLEQENNALATDPRFGLKSRARHQARPPSIHVLKQLVEDPSAAPSRHSLLPNPPPMTELEFWAALVKDYAQTAQRLPTLTSNKLRSGVPAPLRGVVWVSMVGARDRKLGDEFNRLSSETSPFESIIGKDIGRSFPGVEMFRDPEGEGQKMLGTVLNCFSLYDNEIGYCQGLGFLVGPLLMQMGDKDAFCVLVRLMENYGLRSCFLPDLSGLHLRIYQFKRLLSQHIPKLAAHLAALGVEAAYLSQWFLSFFAVTCPLIMLFRIYDVIFAEGASETIMRVALSLVRRNEEKIMASMEFDEVMQLLLSRSLWDCYSSNADELVHDFIGLTGVVTRESLDSLETSFKDANGDESGVRFGFLPDVTAAASRFLGRLWTSVPTAKYGTLSPSPVRTSTSRPDSFIRRSTSKQSIASTLNGTDNSSEGTNSLNTAATELTIRSRKSSGDMVSIVSKSESLVITMPGTVSKEDKDLHGQIEDLLKAFSEMQREHNILASQLQNEREERGEDHRVFRDLAQRITTEASNSPRFERRKSAPTNLKATLYVLPISADLGNVVDQVDQRLRLYRKLKRSSVLETKKKLRDSLVRNKDQLQIEVSRSSELTRQLDQQEQETAGVKDQLREARSRLQDGMKERQRLEKTVQDLRTERSSMGWADNTDGLNQWDSDTSDKRMSVVNNSRTSVIRSSGGGLRELKLGRPGSVIMLHSPASSVPKRSTSLATQAILSTQDHAPATEDDLLVELVNAKTAEALARQECEEARAKIINAKTAEALAREECEEVKTELDALRKVLGVPLLPAAPPAVLQRLGPSDSRMFSVSISNRTPKCLPSGSKGVMLTPPSSAANAVAGIWGWGKRSMSAAKTE